MRFIRDNIDCHWNVNLKLKVPRTEKNRSKNEFYLEVGGCAFKIDVH